MSEKVITILQHGDEYVAGVFTPKGLYATSLPRSSIDEAINAVDGFDLPEVKNTEYRQILEVVFDICNGKKVAQNRFPILDFSDLTPKQVDVLKTTMKIPYGSTWSYGLVAQHANVPGAARFVGNVMASNRFAPIVPCHRVVSTTGLGGYTGGLDLKVSLLSKEGAFAD
ncbi:MAG: methylated-DNA--[protein]-cysteine S-methyltransferase [Candidatus Thorarchaeota archaeon]